MFSQTHCCQGLFPSLASGLSKQTITQGGPGSLGWGRGEPRAPGQAYLPAQFCWDPDDTPGLAGGSRSTDPHLGAVLGDKEELGECAMQGQEDASLGHILKQAVLHLGEELPQGLQQREVTEVAVGGGGQFPGVMPTRHQTELQLRGSLPP